MAHLVAKRISHGALTTEQRTAGQPTAGSPERRQPDASQELTTPAGPRAGAPLPSAGSAQAPAGRSVPREHDHSTGRNRPAALRRALVFALLAGALCLAAATLVPSGRAALRDDEIDKSALRHDPNGPDQVLWTTAENPKLRFLFLRFRMKKDDVKEAGARLYLINAQGQEGFRDHLLEPWATVDSLEYRALTVPFEDDPTAPPNRTHWRGYRLYADDEGDIDWYGADSVATHEEKVARFTTLFRRGAELKGELPGLSDRMLVIPAWAQDAVVVRTRLEWSALDPDSLLARRLNELRHDLPGLDSLAVNTLLVEGTRGSSFPLDRCWPPAPTGDAMADSLARVPTPCGRLVALCASAHRRQMKVMAALNVAIPGEVRNAGEERALQTLGLAGLDNAALRDSLLAVVRQGIGCGIDGFYLRGYYSDGRDSAALVTADDDPIWRSLHETAQALLPEAYVVLEGSTPDPGDPTRQIRWLADSRVDALADGLIGRAAEEFAGEKGPTGEVFEQKLGRLRLATPGPLGRIAWLGPEFEPGTPLTPSAAGEASLLRLLHLTLQGATALESAGDAPAGAGLAARLRAGRPGLPGLLALRRDHPALRRGSFNIAYAQGGQFAFYRRSSEEILLVAVNRDAAPATIRITLPKGVGFVSVRNVVDLLTGTQYAVRGGEITLKDLPAQGGVIVQLR